MRSLLAVFSFFILSQSAFAGFYLEPYVSYATGTTKGDLQSNLGTGTFDSKDTGSALGAKIGWSMMMFSFGADYMAESVTSKDQTTPPDPDEKDKYAYIGAFAQIKLPFVKFSATYYPSAKLTTEDDDTATGSALKAGVGFTFLPFVSINIDYLTGTFDDFDIAGVTVTSGDIKHNMILVGVSFPINF